MSVPSMSDITSAIDERLGEAVVIEFQNKVSRKDAKAREDAKRPNTDD